MTEERVRVRARELYRMALADAAWTPSRIRARTGWSAEELERALQRLARLGLVTPFDEAPSGWSVLSPATAMAHLVESSERRTEELVEAVTRSRAALAEVVGDYQAVHTEQFAAQQVEVAVHPAQVAAILEEAAQRAGSEILSLHPGRPFSPAQLLAGDERNREAINRGVTMRSIHLAASAAAPHMRTHLRELVQSGAEVRTAATLPMRLIIVDRSLAIVPAEEPEDENAAMVIRNAALVSVLRRVFDHCWASAADLLVGDGEGDAGWAMAGTRNHEVVRMLAAGLTDEAIGRKLGLSDRTVRRIVAELMSQVGAESRFQAGVNMVRLGWLDDAPPPPLSGALPAIG